MTKKEAQGACRKAENAAKANWPRLDISTATVVPVMRDILDFSPISKSYFAYHDNPFIPAAPPMDSIRIELDTVGGFVLGYNAEHNVLAMRCRPKDGWYIPVTTTEGRG